MDSRNNGLDAIKGLACMAVIFIHVLFPEPLKMTVKSMMRFAVPVFVIISGYYFLDSNGSCSSAATARKLRAMTALLLKVSAFYAVFALAYYNLAQPAWNIRSFLRRKATAGRLVKLFLTNDPIVYFHLWYLLAMIYTYLFALLYFGEGKRLKSAGWLGGVLLVGYSLLEEFSGRLGFHAYVGIPGSDQRLYFFRLFVFRALPFFLIGIAIRQSEERIKSWKISKTALLVGALLFSRIAAIECGLTNDTQFFIGNILAALCLVIYAVRWPDAGAKGLSYIGNRLSKSIYILHIAVLNSLQLLFLKLSVQNTRPVIWGLPLYTLAVTIGISWLIERVKSRRAAA